MKRWEVEGWQKDDLDSLELSFLKKIFSCDNAESVSAACAYAAYMNKIGVNPDNYPIFLKMIDMPNHWVVDALVGKNDPSTFFEKVQPNYYILRECFRSLARSTPKNISSKALLLYLGLLKVTYEVPYEGYEVYPVSAENMNHLGKHLDESKDQTNEVNQNILLILDRIASLFDPGRPDDEEAIITVATQANNIRGKFLDITKSLKEAIPDELLKSSAANKEVAPLRAKNG
ncbi:MAG: hypothetical protein OEZ34_10015 [Spirochaetia bacterium]|nr:hypothetical protein [Spirochaetia bacterium]